MDRGTNQSAFLDIIKTLEIAFGITFENKSNEFIIGSKLEHRKCVTSIMK